MAHFAQLDENNIVTQVVVVSNADLLDENGVEQETLGVAVCQSIFGNYTTWVQTSYHNNLRKQYAGVGFTYDADANVFIAPSPFPSWVLNAQHDWEAPEPKPEGDYAWNEETLSWEPIPTENPAP
jgi:hypothetical protein